MDFEFSEEQNLLRSTIREFAEAEIRPKMMEWDEKQEFPWDCVKQLGELGLMGMHVSRTSTGRRRDGLRRVRAGGRGAVPGGRFDRA